MSSRLPVDGSKSLKRSSIAMRDSGGRGGSLVFGKKNSNKRMSTGGAGSFMSLSDFSVNGSGVIGRTMGGNRRGTVSGVAGAVV